MESLSSSRYLHRKLSGGLSGKKNPYDDVFAGQPARVPKKISSPKEAQDYKEIFGSSRVSSIPILDLPPPDLPNSNKLQLLDYSNIFGADHNVNDNDATTLSYQQLPLSSNNPKIANKTSSPHSRSPSAATEFPLQDTDHMSKDDKVFPPEASYQLFDDKKQFNMSYHKTSLGCKDGENGTIHVAQFHHVPGFTCFVDESSPENTEADKPNPLPKNDIRSEVDFGKGMPDGRNANKAKNVANKQDFGRVVKSRSGFSWDGSYSSDRLFNAHDDLKSHPSKVRPLSGMASNLKHNDDHSKRWTTAGNAEAPETDVSEHGAGDYSPPFFGEELVENSAAAASAAVLRNAIQKAQESIRIAKELMERKREGLRRSSTQNFKDKSRVVDRRENIIPREGRRSEDNNAKDTCASADSIPQVFSGMGKKSALRSGDVVSGFKDTERIIVAGKATIDEHAKNLLAAEKSEPTWFSSLVNMRKNRTAISSIDEAVRNFQSRHPIVELECNVKETNVISKTLKKQQEVIHKDQADEKALEVEYMERKPITVSAWQESVDNVDKLESGCVVHEHEVIGKAGFPENEQKQTGFYRNEDCEKKLVHKRTIEGESNFEGQRLENDFEKRLGIAQELEENENEKEEDSRQENIEKRGKYVDNEVYELKQKRIHDEDVDEEFEDASHWEEDENELEAWSSEREGKNEKDIYMGEDTKSRAEDVQALNVDGKTSEDLHVGKERDEPYEEFELEENENGVEKSYRSEEKMYIEMEADKIEVLQEAHHDENDHKASNSWSNNANDNISETQDCQCGIDSSTEPNQALNDKLRIGAIEDSKDFEMGEAETLKFLHKLKEKETSRTASLVQGDAEDGETKTKMRVAFEVFLSEDSAPKFGSYDVGFGKTEFVEWETENLDNHIEIQADGFIKVEDISGEDVTSDDEESGNSCVGKFNREQYTTIKADFGTSHRYSVSKEEKTIQIDENIRTRENTETNEEKFLKNPAMYENETNIYEEMKTKSKEGNEENPTKFPSMEEKTGKATAKAKEEKEYLMQIDEANKREREREKEKMAVERAIREVRERAFAEARERAERAAVERATVEVRHRVMDEAWGKHEKATAVTKSLAEKASIEAKFRSERAAVERATAEARERALQKALSQKVTSRAHGASFVTEKFSAPCRDNAIKKSLSSSDLQIPDESNNESSQRGKARSERDEKIMERAARALAEKNKRDLLAQKEQAEKNRISEALDADIKRWSSGKEGNLRALLSTLQYILGPASGWQAIPLTDIVTPSDVKKAYRKATLYVHPDKLQQRGASIQQKYICEKVFDLLKAAWNRFNSEER